MLYYNDNMDPPPKKKKTVQVMIEAPKRVSVKSSITGIIGVVGRHRRKTQVWGVVDVQPELKLYVCAQTDAVKPHRSASGLRTGSGLSLATLSGFRHQK